MPSPNARKQHAINELNDFFNHHAASLTAERITIELERIPSRYKLDSDTVLLNHLRKRLNETTPKTHPELHQHGQSYLQLKYLTTHATPPELFGDALD